MLSSTWEVLLVNSQLNPPYLSISLQFFEDRVEIGISDPHTSPQYAPSEFVPIVCQLP